jgi:serine/threonine protein kinase
MTERVRDRASFGVEKLPNSCVRKVVPYAAESEREKMADMGERLSSVGISVPHAWVVEGEPRYLYMDDIGEHLSLQESIGVSPSSREVQALVRKAAQALAALHAQPPARGGPGEHVLLHGDFSPQNILLTNDAVISPRIWIIDPSPNFYGSFEVHEFGDPMVDVATFTLRLIWPLRASTYRRLSARLALRRLFFQSYESYSDSVVATKTSLIRHEAGLFVRYLALRKVLRLHDRIMA